MKDQFFQCHTFADGGSELLHIVASDEANCFELGELSERGGEPPEVGELFQVQNGEVLQLSDR